MNTLIAKQNDTITATEQFDWANISANGQSILKLGTHENLFLEGDDADFVYEVVDGLIMAYSFLSDGRRQITSFHHSGDVIGLSHDGLHHTNCSAIGSAKVRSIPRRLLMREIQSRPDIAAKLLVMTTHQLANMGTHFAVLGCKSAMEKVASFLLVLTTRYADEDALSATFSLPMTRSEIGDYLGLTIETVSRTLSKLKIAGVVEMPKTSIVHIPDIIQLEQIAECDE